MLFKFPKSDDKYHWTNHVCRKMVFYGLSPDRIKRVLRSPKRSELGVAENTIAVMQPAGSKQKPTEIWVMYQEGKKKDSKKATKKVIITAWRYPGTSPVRDQIPIPTDILEELRRENLIESLSG